MTNDIKDLKDLTVDKTQPIVKRIEQYISDVNNPYTVKVGDMVVQIEFSGGKKFSDALSAVFSM